MSGPNDFDTIRTAILNQTSDNTVIIAMLVGAGLESDWKINAPGGGAFQITDPARALGGTAFLPNASGSFSFSQGSFSSAQIDLDVRYMLPRYVAAATIHKNDTESPDKYANIAYDAERPAQHYQQSQGEKKIQSVYQTVVQNYGSVNAQATAPVETQNPALAFLQPVISFLGDLTDIHMWRSLGWILLGILLLVGGVILWLRSGLGNIAKSVI